MSSRIASVPPRRVKVFSPWDRLLVPPLERPAQDDQSLYKRIIEGSREGLVVVDADGHIVFCNRAAATFFGSTPDDLCGREFGFPYADLGEPASIEIFTGGQPTFMEMIAAPIFWRDGEATIVHLRDVTRWREAEAQLGMQAKALEAAANGILITNRDGMISWANPAFIKMAGFDVEDVIGKSATMLKADAGDDPLSDAVAHLTAMNETWKGRVVNRRKDGSLYTAEQTTTPIRDATGRLSHFVTVLEDISDRLKAEDELVRLSEYDVLTGLPNRSVFMDRLKLAIDRAARADASVAVMVMDLDNFKSVNNTLGHDVGDALLRAVTQRVQKITRTTDTLARLGGDDFGILLEDVTDMAAASRTVRSIVNAFHKPVEVNGQSIEVTVSVGIAAYPQDDTDPLALLREAELAMYQAKSEGRDAFRYFDKEMDADIRRRVKIEADLRHAVDQNQLWLAYQPQLDLATGKIVGAEALIRWNHPERGLVSPGEFIPIAETSGLILPIGDWIIEEICRQRQIWQALGLPEMRLGFNVSGVQFRQRNLFEQVTSALQRSGLSPSSLDIEITESVAMEGAGRVQENVDRLTAAGVAMSMDDFGTGYSSLSNLQAFPISRLKVDGSFVRGIGRTKDDEKIVEAVVRLGQSLGLTVVAEGVETIEQLRFLKERACDEIQGYWLSKPLPPTEFRRFVESFTCPDL
ncbi:MAG: EAL domain-containing protein [Rhodospirillaceae bacterium]|nr:EAL domain-containing protein [Rhodospirillaceae bacterium]